MFSHTYCSRHPHHTRYSQLRSACVSASMTSHWTLSVSHSFSHPTTNYFDITYLLRNSTIWAPRIQSFSPQTLPLRGHHRQDKYGSYTWSYAIKTLRVSSVRLMQHNNCFVRYAGRLSLILGRHPSITHTRATTSNLGFPAFPGSFVLFYCWTYSFPLDVKPRPSPTTIRYVLNNQSFTWMVLTLLQ
jgi:hypothetical protein